MTVYNGFTRQFDPPLFRTSDHPWETPDLEKGGGTPPFNHQSPQHETWVYSPTEKVKRPPQKRSKAPSEKVKTTHLKPFRPT